MAPGLKPFQLLEINIISAQDLEPLTRKMRTYATAWVNQNRKLSSCVDAEGNNNPTWNDKFVFRVDDEFLQRDTSAIMIEIYAEHWFRDKLVGTVRVLVGNLIPPSTRSNSHNHRPIGMRCVALQVRRPSGRPQGILNIGVAVLDGSMRSMPLYTQLSTSAVGYRDLMDDPPSLQILRQNDNNRNNNNNNNNNNQPTNVKPILRRSKSERSERVTFEKSSPNSSILAVAGKQGAKESSILSITESTDPFKLGMTKKGKASSVISGAELREKPKRNKGKKSKASSVLSDSIYSKESSVFHKIEIKPKNKEQNKILDDKPTSNELSENKVVDEKLVSKPNGMTKNTSPPKDKKPPVPLPTIGKPIPKYNVYEYGTPQKGSFPQGKYVIGAPLKGNSLWSDSEVGPSPSEVAAVMAEKRYPLEQDNQSSVLSGWSLDESVEGLRSKLERWRTELPPLYDRGNSTSTYRSSTRHARQSNDNGSGLFSCFGNIYGYECQCVCGKPPGKRSRSTRFYSPSTVTPGRSFL